MNIKQSFSVLTMIALFSSLSLTAGQDGQDRSWKDVSLDWTVWPVWKFCAAPYNLFARQEDFDKNNKINSLDVLKGESTFRKDAFDQERSLQYRNRQFLLTSLSLLSAGAAVWSFKAGHPCGRHDAKVKAGLVATALTTACAAWKMRQFDNEDFEKSLQADQGVSRNSSES